MIVSPIQTSTHAIVPKQAEKHDCSSVLQRCTARKPLKLIPSKGVLIFIFTTSPYSVYTPTTPRAPAVYPHERPGPGQPQCCPQKHHTQTAPSPLAQWPAGAQENRPACIAKTIFQIQFHHGIHAPHAGMASWVSMTQRA